MHEDIQKLIDIAKEGGELTEKQKEIILRKAAKLGEDVEEIEMILETHGIKPSGFTKQPNKKEAKCPNCGAIIQPFQTKCDECGFVFHMQENAYAQTLSERYRLSTSKVAIINSIVSPNSVEELTETISFLISLFDDKDTDIAKASIAKAKGILVKSKQIAKKSDELTEMVSDFEDKIELAEVNFDFKRGEYTRESKIVLAVGAILSLVMVYFEWTLLDWKPIWRIILMLYTASLPLSIALGVAKKKQK